MVFYSIFFSEGIWRISSLIVLLAAFITFNELQNSFYDGTFFSNSSDGTNCSQHLQQVSESDLLIIPQLLLGITAVVEVVLLCLPHKPIRFYADMILSMIWLSTVVAIVVLWSMPLPMTIYGMTIYFTISSLALSSTSLGVCAYTTDSILSCVYSFISVFVVLIVVNLIVYEKNLFIQFNNNDNNNDNNDNNDNDGTNGYNGLTLPFSAVQTGTEMATTRSVYAHKNSNVSSKQAKASMSPNYRAIDVNMNILVPTSTSTSNSSSAHSL
jgi:hypothetical protein